MPEQQKKTAGKRQKKQKALHFSPLPLATGLAVLLLLLVAAGLLLLLSRSGNSQGESSTGGITLWVTVPENDYDSESFVTNQDGTVSYADQEYYSVAGIDVSSHQGEIDWQAVAEAGVEFAILRIGYRGYTAGSLNQDSSFQQNLAGAQENGLQVGVYFYSQAITVDEAREEAEYVLSLLGDSSLEMAVFYDWEKQTAEGSRTLDSDVSILTDCALAFCQTIQTGGYTAGIYFYSSLALDTYDLSRLTEYSFWLSQPGEVPSFRYRFALWQYSYTGEVPGITGAVDLDMLLVSEDQSQ